MGKKNGKKKNKKAGKAIKPEKDRSPSKNDLLARLRVLEKTAKDKDAYIEHLEKLSDAYDHLEQLATKELMEADQVIKAQEMLQDLMSQERLNAEETIRAQEIVQSLSGQEKEEAEQVIRAQQSIIELAQREKRDREEVIHAHESLEEWHRREKIQDDSTIKAHENLEALSDAEKREADELIRAHEQLSSLSMKELMERDDALRNILDVNRGISSLLEEEGSLLIKILKSLATTLHAQRGILLITENRSILSRNFFNMAEQDMEKKAFDFPASIIRQTVDSAKSSLIINQKVKLGRANANISIITVPLIYEERLLGVIYLDIISDKDTFKTLDLDVAEIFSSQAAISINNSYLYDKIRKQNGELLRLINLKTRFISHISEELSTPVSGIVKRVEKLMDSFPNDPADLKKILDATRVQAKKIDNTVHKVLTIVSLEQEVEDLFVDHVSFPEVLKTVLDKHMDEIQRKRIQISWQFTKEFDDYNGNNSIMRTIIDEMTSNSIFYNREGGTVTIRGYRRDDYLIIEFEDTGYGIRKKDIDLVFQQFYRTEESEKMNQWGAGLGLYMVRTFIEHYKGAISVETHWRKGSKFTLNFLYH